MQVTWSCAIILVLCVTMVIGEEPGVILTRGEHFDDLVRDGSTRVSKNTVLIIYNHNCLPELNFLDIPSPQHQYFFTSGPDALGLTWFNPLPTDDLKKRYDDGPNCQAVLFFKKGEPFTAGPRRWTEDTDLSILDWVWDQSKVMLTLTNNYGEALIVKFDNGGKGPVIMAGKLEIGETTEVPSYPGHSITIRTASGEKDVFNKIINSDDKTIVIDLDVKLSTLAEVTELESRRNNMWHSHQISTACRHLLIMKQPLIVPKLTEEGYRKMSMPPKIYKEILTAYLENYDEREPEGMIVRDGIFVNTNMMRSSKVIDVPAKIVDKIAADLQPLVEDFCGRSVQFHDAYGIQENYAGNALYMSVGAIADQVITVALQVEEESEEGWPLSLIDFEGWRRQVTLNAGEMFIYESAKIIVGRPETYQGTKSAICYFYFVPLEGWPYIQEGMELVDPETGFREQIGHTVTSLTVEKKVIIPKEEL